MFEKRLMAHRQPIVKQVYQYAYRNWEEDVVFCSTTAAASYFYFYFFYMMSAECSPHQYFLATVKFPVSCFWVCPFLNEKRNVEKNWCWNVR